MLLVMSHTNYADEFDVDGFFLVEEESWERYKELATNFFGKVVEKTYYPGSTYTYEEYERFIHLWFGTNEALISEGPTGYLQSFEEKPIDEATQKVLEDTFGIAPLTLKVDSEGFGFKGSTYGIPFITRCNYADTGKDIY